MKKTTIYLMSIAGEGQTNGVERHISIFIKHLITHPEIECFHFLFSPSLKRLRISERLLTTNCKQICIPLPCELEKNKEWSRCPFPHVKLIKHIFGPLLAGRNRRILHVHTINLMPFALSIKKIYRCRIISHIHCIPWKYLYDIDIHKYNILTQGEKVKINRDSFFSVYGEKETYNFSDKIICVSESGKRFVLKMQEHKKKNIYIIPNGIVDDFEPGMAKTAFLAQTTFQILFVGGETSSKGLNFLLESMNLLPDYLKAQTSIILAGKYSASFCDQIKNKYHNLNIVVLGILTYKELKMAYYNCDLGIIMSLHEQCSYAAIEMMMHQIPIISTDADGLKEMFTDGINAVIIPIVIDENSGTAVPDIHLLSRKLEELIKDADLRKSLATSARRNFLEKYNAEEMSNNIMSLYKNLENES